MLLEREAFLDLLKGPAGRLVLVGGEPGVGKTALVRAFAQRADGRVLWGACDPLETPRPLGPLQDVADVVGGELAAAVAVGARPGSSSARCSESCAAGPARCSCSRTSTGPTRARSTCSGSWGGGSAACRRW